MAGLSLSLLLVVGLVAWVALDDDPYVAPTRHARGPDRGPSARGRGPERARGGGGRRAAGRGRRTLADPDDEQAREQLADLVENARGARVDDFTLRYVDELGAVADDGVWQAAVDTTWAFRGFDRAPAMSEVRFGFRVSGDHVVVTSIGGGDRRSPLWMTAPLEIDRGPDTLVLVGGDAREADAYAARARAAVPVVRAVLPGWKPRLVVEVPPTRGGPERGAGQRAGGVRPDRRRHVHHGRVRSPRTRRCTSSSTRRSSAASSRAERRW